MAIQAIAKNLAQAAGAVASYALEPDKSPILSKVKLTMTGGCLYFITTNLEERAIARCGVHGDDFLTCVVPAQMLADVLASYDEDDQVSLWRDVENYVEAGIRAEIKSRTVLRLSVSGRTRQFGKIVCGEQELIDFPSIALPAEWPSDRTMFVLRNSNAVISAKPYLYWQRTQYGLRPAVGSKVTFTGLQGEFYGVERENSCWELSEGTTGLAIPIGKATLSDHEDWVREKFAESISKSGSPLSEIYTPTSPPPKWARPLARTYEDFSRNWEVCISIFKAQTWAKGVPTEIGEALREQARKYIWLRREEKKQYLIELAEQQRQEAIAQAEYEAEVAARQVFADAHWEKLAVQLAPSNYGEGASKKWVLESARVFSLAKDFWAKKSTISNRNFGKPSGSDYRLASGLHRLLTSAYEANKQKEPPT